MPEKEDTNYYVFEFDGDNGWVQYSNALTKESAESMRDDQRTRGRTVCVMQWVS